MCVNDCVSMCCWITSPFVIFAVFDVQVLKCCRQQVYKLMFCTFIISITDVRSLAYSHKTHSGVASYIIASDVLCQQCSLAHTSCSWTLKCYFADRDVLLHCQKKFVRKFLSSESWRKTNVQSPLGDKIKISFSCFLTYIEAIRGIHYCLLADWY